jgi:peptidoglycan-N-acetylmuramic acid deacetylase
MFKKKLPGLLMGILLSNVNALAQTREIAITIDDLPFVGHANHIVGKLYQKNGRLLKIIQALMVHKIPAAGFIIAGTIDKSQLSLLDMFRREGFLLGNHTYSHLNLDKVTASVYIDDIEHADKILQPLLTQPKYFRYPYLAKGLDGKKQCVYDYLNHHNYIVAPVTIDSKDYEFNKELLAIPSRQRAVYLTTIKQRYLAFVWHQTLQAEARLKKQHKKNAKQILLIHANVLNSYFLNDVIEMYQKNGYTFISLTAALNSPAPMIKTPINDDMTIVGKEILMSQTFITKWSLLTPVIKQIFLVN